MIDSVCVCLTFKCDLKCKHCFVAAGPKRTEEMTVEQTMKAVDNSTSNCKRLWFSGGEPTVVMEKLLLGLDYASKKKNQTGFPQYICVQTNGNFAKTKKEAVKYLAQFYRHGANEIDITSNDVFHFEQMDQNIPMQLAKIANDMGVFENVSIGGSAYKVVKRFGRAKNIAIKELQGFDMKYADRCVLTKSDFVIHPNGNVLPCIYGFDNVMGNIFKETLEDILTRYSGTKACKELRGYKAYELLKQTRNQEKGVYHKDICEICNEYFKLLKVEGDE